jgi:hypothetical protein
LFTHTFIAKTPGRKEQAAAGAKLKKLTRILGVELGGNESGAGKATANKATTLPALAQTYST